MLNDPIIVAPYDPAWKDEFIRYGVAIRSALGNIAVRIDHIGSTAVKGLDAKPIIDIQVSVISFEPMSLYQEKLEEIGFIYRVDNPDLTKRYFRESSGSKRVHLHVREKGSWAEQFNLLFRDYLRCHGDECKLYADIKYSLMQNNPNDRELYVKGKEPIIWEIMRRASTWSRQTGWKASVTDI